jgi:hypothetical protein
MGEADTLVALELAQKYMAQDQFTKEASLAAARIAANYMWQDAKKAMAVFAKVEAAVTDGRARDVIRRAREEAKRYRGYILAWKVAGPYQVENVRSGEHVFRTKFPPEDPAAKGVKWITLKRRMEGDRINLEATFGGLDHVCAYVRTRVWSPEAQDAKLDWNADDYITGWINGKPTGGGDITLRQGDNDLMLKVGDHEGGWSFRCRILKRDGAPLEGLKFNPN